MIQIPRIMIAAAKSGSGKTMFTCGLLSVFKEKYRLQAIKCGPDYIDPMFHRNVLGIPSKNLDTYFTKEQLTRELFVQAVERAEFAVLEGVMGLYDGLGGVKKEGSSYHLAQVTRTPIILLVDAHGMGKSVAALIRGFLDYDRDRLICGVILNRTSRMFYEAIKPEIEQELKVPVLGFLPRLNGVALESRHLGLVMPEELPGLQKQLSLVAEAVRENIELERIEELAKNAPPLNMEQRFAGVGFSENREKAGAEERAKSIKAAGEEERTFSLGNKQRGKVRIGVARDEAFCFYYEDNLRLLEEAGSELVEFSPLKDQKLPEEINGLLLGGGYPELYASRLSENQSMRYAVKTAIKAGMPTLAECGGFLYLHEMLEDMEKKKYPMAGVIEAEAFYTGKSVRFGYVELQEKAADFLPEQSVILGHEFHYFDSTENGNDCIARKTVSGKSWECVHKNQDSWMGFAHLYYPSNPMFAKHFVERVRAFAERKSKE